MNDSLKQKESAEESKGSPDRYSNSNSNSSGSSSSRLGEGVGMEQSWKDAYQHTKEKCAALLLSLGDAQATFALCKDHILAQGLLQVLVVSCLHPNKYTVIHASNVLLLLSFICKIVR